MDRRLRVTQIVVGVLIVAIVASLFLFGMVGGGKPADQKPTAAPAAPSSSPPRKVEEGQRLPGELAKPLDQVERFEDKAPRNPDRQLDYKPTVEPSIELAKGLTDLRAYAEQEVKWSDCGRGSHCATVLAPLDWDNPGDGRAVELAVRRVPSANPTNGPIFVNPGGPGAGGADYAITFGKERWEGYDIVGWDPRGTGASTNVVCGTLKQTDAVFGLDHSPDDADEDKALQDGYRDFAQQCRDNSGDLLDHISSVEVVRDMDLLRHLMGGDKFNFVGVSYGTYIGALYAELFPDTSGKLVLDAAVEITDDEPIYQIEGFELAFRNWADWCAEQEVCVLHGKSSEEIQQAISDWLDSLDKSPLKVGDRMLTQSHAASGIALFLYGDSNVYRILAMAIQEAMSGEGQNLLEASDELNARRGNGYDTLAYAFPAMLCVDESDEGVAKAEEETKKILEKAPMLGRHMGISYMCPLWTADAPQRFKITAKGADPILVVGTTGDSATPYEQAVRMARQLEPAGLLTLDGPGHGAVSGGNPCINEVVDKFFADGTLPEEGKTCKS